MTRKAPEFARRWPWDGLNSIVQPRFQAKSLIPAAAGPDPNPQDSEAEASVLIVDGSAADRGVVGRLIEQAEGLNLRVRTASNGREALDSMSRELPSLVLADLQSPDMGGPALVRTIRELHPDVPLVLMTAHGGEELAFEAVQAGAASFVPKKMLAQHLASTLQNILELSARQRRHRQVLSCMGSRSASFTLGNEPELHAPLIGLLIEDLKDMGLFDSAVQLRIGVAIQEALNNAMFHGNLEVGSELRQDDERVFHALAEERRRRQPYASRRIRVDARIVRTIEDVFCSFSVSDDGPGFDATRLDRPFDPEDLMRIGGRGLLLIRAFMDQVFHNEAGNQITMIKRGDVPRGF